MPGSKEIFPPPPLGAPCSGLESLTVELLLLICEHLFLSRKGVADLHILRLTSKRLNQVAIPFVFREIHITPQITHSGPLDRTRNRTRRVVWGFIREHTKQVFICPYRSKGFFNWNDVIKLLARCKQLQSINYRYRASIVVTRQSFSRALKNVFETKWRNVRLHINGYRFRSSDFKSIPVSNVVSFRRLRTAGGVQVLPSFTGFLISATRLEDLHLTYNGNLVVPQDDKQLPPIKKLKLFSYDWNYSSEDSLKIWDFSRLEKLKFQNGSVDSCCRFLQTIPFHHIPRIRKFSLVTSEVPHTNKLIWLTMEAITNFTCLESLRLNCYKPSLLISSLETMGHSLVDLALRDDYLARKDTLSNEHIDDIIRLCPKLQRLDIDLNIPENETLALYESLAQSSTLTDIKLCTRLKSMTPEAARNKAHADRAYILSKYPGVSMKIERLYVMGWNEHVIDDERDWKVMIAMRRSAGGHFPEDDSWSQRKPHEKEDLGIGGVHYC